MVSVCIFIDGSNLYHSVKNLTGSPRLDFKKFCEKLCDGREFVRAYYYISPVDQNESPSAYSNQQKFFSYLNNVPYLELRLGRLVTRSRMIGKKPYYYKTEKGVDVLLATDMIKFAFDEVYDTAILVSGDGDFADAVKAVKDNGNHVELAHFASGDSKQLKNICDKCVLLDQQFINNCK